jgi:hypothetical protein
LKVLSGRWHLVAVALVAFAMAWPMQGGGGVPNAHYVLVKALASGTPRIDHALNELGDFSTYDYAVYKGHKYANKAPGFGFLALPPYVVLKALGARTVGDPTRMLWALGLFVAVLPAIVLVLLVRERSEWLAPGFGTAAAVTLGLGTLVFPQATLFMPHVLSAALAFAVFALLWRERTGPARLLLLGAAGLIAGYAVTTEYPNVVSAAVLGLYALARSGWIKRAAAYGAGFVLGLVPLAAYNLWAYGSVTHASFPREHGGGNAGDLLGAPSFGVLVKLLFGATGLIVLTPVLAAGAAGTVLLYRRGHRLEALAIAAIVAGYLLFYSAYVAPAPRHLVPLLPFLAVPLALAFRELPATTGALALVSGIVMTLMTATYALAGYDDRWLDRFSARQLTPSAASLVGITGWYATLPIVAAAAAAAVVAFSVTARPRLRWWEPALAGGAALAWAALAADAPSGGESTEVVSYTTLWLLLGLAALGAITAAVYALATAPRSPARETQ